MHTIIKTDATSNQVIDFYSSVFEAIQFKVVKVNFDPDCFSVKLNHLENNQCGNDSVSIESLLIGSLEMFSRIVINSNQFYQSSSYFLNLKPEHLRSKFYYVEVDYLNTTNDVVFLEAYCYDENEVLIAKAGTLTLKN